MTWLDAFLLLLSSQIGIFIGVWNSFIGGNNEKH